MIVYLVSWSLLSLLSLIRAGDSTESRHTVAITSSPSSQWVALGSKVDFYCTALGSPHPTYYWKKKGSTLLPPKVKGQHSSHLVIPDIGPTDAGEYFCTAKNQYSISHSRKAWLHIQESSSSDPVDEDPPPLPPVPKDAVLSALSNSGDSGTQTHVHAVAIVVPVISVVVCLLATVVAVCVLVSVKRKRARSKKVPRRSTLDRVRKQFLLDLEDV